MAIDPAVVALEGMAGFVTASVNSLTQTGTVVVGIVS
jgi:hypothetical protein